MEKRVRVGLEDLRKFGITIGVALIAIIGLIYFKRRLFSMPLFTTALILLALSWLKPVILKPAYTAWMKFAFVLGWINTRLLLIIIFYFVFTPIGLVMRLFGMDLLNRKVDKKKESYWEKKEPGTGNYERQF